MKHLNIIITLTLVVLISSIGVYFVEDITTPIIDAYNIRQANLAKFEVFPELEATDDISPEEDYDFTGTTITELIIVDGKGYIYSAEFQGFQSIITYMIGIDLDGNLTGYKTLTQGDTPGLGAEIANPDFYPQFIGLSTDDAADGNIDGIGGSTITTGGLIGSLNKVIEFHNVEFEGAVAETPEMRLIRLKEEITEVGATFTDVSSDYDLTNTPITKVEKANDTAVIYTITAEGYYPGILYLVAFDLTTNDIIGFRVIEHSETPSIGDVIDDETFQAQFDDLDQDEVDSIGGSTATVTLGGIKTTLEEVVIFHKAEFQGIVVETEDMKRDRLWLELFPEATEFRDIYRDYTAHHDIEEAYEVYNGAVYLGNLYFVIADGASYSEETYVEFYLGIAADKTFTGFRMWDDNETPGRTNDFYLNEYGDSYTGDNIEEEYIIDDIAGSTLTNNILQGLALDVAVYHIEVYLGLVFARPENKELVDADLRLAYPSASSFNSVYDDYTYDDHIYNIYEALDGSDAVIGYVYYGHAEGYTGAEIEFAWGVDLTGLTQKLAILNDTESWEYAQEWRDYDGSQGYWPDTPWITNFDNVLFSDLLSDPDIDDVANVSTTTENMRIVLEGIAQYHSDESVGGAG